MTASVSRISEAPTESWETFVFGKLQVKLRHREGTLTGFSAAPIQGQKTLPSVSRRFPYRDQIDIWNSRNVAYAVSNIHALRVALNALTRGRSWDEAIQTAAKSAVLSKAETTRLVDVLRDVSDLKS